MPDITKGEQLDNRNINNNNTAESTNTDTTNTSNERLVDYDTNNHAWYTGKLKPSYLNDRLYYDYTAEAESARQFNKNTGHVYDDEGSKTMGLELHNKGFRDSYYDKYATTLGDFDDLNEVRAREQGFISKIGGGLGKFATITAAGTVGNIVGTLAGIAEGFSNVVEGDSEKGDAWDRFWTGFWSNKVNTYMNDVIKSAEEAMPVYESKAYQNAGFLDRVFSANFLSGFIANMGWTSSAILSTVLTGGMGAASLGSSIARSLGASKNAANWVYRLVGACTGSMAEASTEAINNYDEAKQDYYNLVSSDYKNQKAALDAEMQQYYQSEIERLGLQQNPEQEPIRVNGLTAQEALWKDVQNQYAAKYAQLESDYERKLATIEDNATKAGINTFGANTFWLTLSNSMGVFSNISTPMSNINRVARGFWKNIFKAAGQKEGISRSELLAREALEAISQGNEEMVQKGAAETAKAYYGQYYNPEFTGQMKDYFDIAGEQYANVYKDPRAWEEFASGMFLGISGAAGAGHKSRKTEDGKVKQGVGFEWTGGLFNAIKESKEVSERSKQIYDDANKIYNDFSKDKNLQARARMVIGVLADKDEMAKAVDNADKKAFLDHEGEQWIRICETFSDIGRMNDLRAMVGQKTDMTDEELREFAAINSEEIKDDKGNGTGRFKSGLPVIDANGELLTNSPDGIKQLRERLQKDQERMNKVIDTYQKTIEDTDAETGYSLSRDQLKVLTWAKMKGLLAEDRQNKIGEELNKKLNWKSLYDAYKNNKTYKDDDKNNYTKFLENEAETLFNIIERYNALENGFTQKSDAQNKSIFESDLKKINQILHTIAGDKKTKEGENKDSLETKNNKSIVDSFFELLDENTKGTLLSSLLGQKIGKSGDKNIYFADIVQDILEKEYGEGASEILDNINDLIKLSSDTRAYDKMFREFVGAPQKIDDMLNETLKKSSDAYIKHKGNQLLKQTDYDIVDNELEKETPENKVKLRDWLRKNNFKYDKHLQSKEYNKELDDNVDNLAANNKMTLSGKTKEFINYLIKNKAFYRQKLLYWDRERFVKEAMDAGFNIDESLQLAANMLDLADMAREHYHNSNALTDIIQKANANPEKTKDRFSTEDTKAPKIISEPNTVIEEIYEYLANHYLVEGGENEKKSQEKIAKYNLPEKDDNAIIEKAKSLVEEINSLCETNPDEVGKNVDNYKKVLLVYYNVLSQLHLQYGGRKGGDTIFNILKSIKNTVKRFKGKMIDQHMLTPIMFDDDYKKCFPNMEVEVVEDSNYKLNYALITDIEYSSPDKGKIKLIVPKGNAKQNGITSPAGSGEFTPSDELLRQMEQYKQQVNQQLSETITTSGFTIHNKAEMEQYIKEHGLDNVQKAFDSNADMQGVEQEMQSIKDKAIADGTFMKAPNGKPTNLTERQWLQVRTKAFKDWFGDWENNGVTVSKDDKTDKYSIYKDGSQIGSFYIDEERGIIYYVELHSDFRGKGLGKFAYIAANRALNKKGIVLKSRPNPEDGNPLHPNAEKIWQNLIKEGLAEKTKYGYDMVMDNSTSKVVDENGEPLQVYHTVDDATVVAGKAQFSIFSKEENGGKMFYFTDNRLMSESYMRRHPTYKTMQDVRKRISKIDSDIQSIENYIEELKNPLPWLERMANNKSMTVDEYIKDLGFDSLDDYKKQNSSELRINSQIEQINELKEERNKLESFTEKDLNATRAFFINSKTPLFINGNGANWDELQINGETKESIENKRKYENDKNKYRQELINEFAEKRDKGTFDSYQEYGIGPEPIELLTEEDIEEIYKRVSEKYPKDYSVDLNKLSTRGVEASIEANKDSSIDGFIVSDVYDYGPGIAFNSKYTEDTIKPGTVVAVRNPNQIKSATDNVGTFSRENNDIRYYTTPDGEIYGFVTPEGEIYIDETKISPEHLIHEYTHLWDKFVREKNPKLWQRGVGLMKQIPLWNEIANSEQYGQKWVKQGKSDNELDNLIASEVHARLVGKNGEKTLNQIAEKDKNAQGIVEKLKQWFLDFWKNLKETFSNWTKEEIEKLTLEDFENMTLRDLIDKVDLKNSPNATYTENTALTDTITGNNTQQQQVLDKIQQISKTLQDRVFFTDENHTYFIYTKDDIENAKKIFSENKITKENASDFGFTYNTISASKLRYQNEEYNPNTNAEVGSLIGNDIDYIVREYFKGTSKEEILNNVKYLRQLNNDGTAAYDNTNKIFEALPKISEEIKEKYGDNCIIYTEPLNMVAVYNDNTKKIIAGTPDMLVIDEKGVTHVFDMKAKKLSSLISKDNKNEYGNTNDYERYSTQVFAYSKMLESFGLPTDYNTAYLIQFKTSDTSKPEYLGLSKLENEDTFKRFTGKITPYKFGEIEKGPKNVGEALQAAALKLKENNSKEEKIKEGNDDKKTDKQTDEALKQKTQIDKLKQMAEKLANNKSEESNGQQGYLFTDYHDYDYSQEKQGKYVQLNKRESIYLREHGAFDFLNNGKLQEYKGDSVYFRDISNDVYKEGDDKSWRLIGMFALTSEGKMQIVGILDPTSRSTTTNGKGDTGRSMRNHISMVVVGNKGRFAYQDKRDEREKNLTKTGEVVNKDNNISNVNIEAQFDNTVTVDGIEYMSLKNKDNKPLVFSMIAPGKIQTRPDIDDNGTHDLRQIQTIKVGNKTFDEAFKNKEIFIGSLIGKDKNPIVIDCDGNQVEDIDFMIPEAFPTGSNIVVYKGGDGLYVCSLIIGDRIKKEDIKESKNAIKQHKIQYNISAKTDKGISVGIANYMAYTNEDSPDGTLMQSSIVEAAYAMLRYTNLTIPEDAISYDISSNTLKLNIIISTEEDGTKNQVEYTINGKNKSSEAIENDIYKLLEDLNARYSFNISMYLVESIDSKTKKNTINSIVENFTSNVVNFSTMNTKAVISYTTDFKLSKSDNIYSTIGHKYKEIEVKAGTDNSTITIRQQSPDHSRQYVARLSDGKFASNNDIATKLGWNIDTNSKKVYLSNDMQTILSAIFYYKENYGNVDYTFSERGAKNGILHILEGAATSEMYFDLVKNRFLTTEEIIRLLNPENTEPSKSSVIEKGNSDAEPKETKIIQMPENKQTKIAAVLTGGSDSKYYKPMSRNKKKNKREKNKDFVKSANKNNLFITGAGKYKAVDLLDKIDNNISKLLKSVISNNTTVTVLNNEEFDNLYGEDTAGIYSAGNGVVLRESSNNSDIIHELCHLVVPSVLQNEEAAAELKEVYKQYKEYLKLHPELSDISDNGVSVSYATTNLYEFLSELFSNKQTANILKEIPNDYFVFDAITNKYAVNVKYRNKLDNNEDSDKVKNNANNDNFLKRIIKTIVNYLKNKFIYSREFDGKNNTLYSTAKYAAEELIKSFNEDLNTDNNTSWAKIDESLLKETESYEQRRAREYKKRVENIVDKSNIENKVTIKQYLQRIDTTGNLTSIMYLITNSNYANSREGLSDLFKELLPTIYQKDFNKEDIDNAIEEYYDYIYGYINNYKQKSLAELIGLLSDYTKKLPLQMGANDKLKKKFGFIDKNSIFVTKKENELKNCKY